MSTKTVSLDSEAYEKLNSIKKSGESFSSLIKRITKERSLLDIAGIWEDKELEENVEKMREGLEEDIKDRVEQME